MSEPLLPPFEPDGKLKFFDDTSHEEPDDSGDTHVNLALLTLPDDGSLATASAGNRKKALSPKPQPKKRIVVASANPVKIGATKAAFIEMHAVGLEMDFTGVNGVSGVSDQPKSHAETRQGAINRAKGVFTSYTDTLYSVGIEGGIEDTPYGMASFAWVAIYDGKQIHCAQSAVFYLPDQVAELIRQGKELGEADDAVFGQTNSKQQNGAVGLLTSNAVTRLEYYAQAVIMAFIPFKNEKLTWTPPDPSVLFVDDEESIRVPAEQVADPVQQNAIVAFQDALKNAQHTESSPVHTIRHQTDLAQLFAACKMLITVFPGLGGLPGPSEEISENDLRALRQALNAREVDLKMLRGQINMKNEEAQRQAIELRKAHEELSKLRNDLSEMILDRNRAQLAAVNAMLDKEELQAQAAPLSEQGYIHSKRMTDPTDEQIEVLLNDDWKRVYEVYGNQHFLRFEKLIPYDVPADNEDHAKAADAAPLPTPVPEPVISHDIILTNPAPAPVNGTITQRLMDGETLADIKADMNEDAIGAGVQAANAYLEGLQDDGPLPVLLERGDLKTDYQFG